MIDNKWHEDWDIIIGLEVHAKVNTKSKLFSSSKTEFGSNPNSQVDFVDAAMPGMLPKVNHSAINQAILLGLAIKAKINKHSVFERKNYFYPDLPQGYQISQFAEPIVIGGEIYINDSTGNRRKIDLNRVHLEQDAGKSIHDQSHDSSFIDLNRSGVPLMEIVSEPQLFSTHDAEQYVKNLRLILIHLGICDGNMQEGSLRVDANISIKQKKDKELGTRCEIKNLNSFRFMKQAIDYEVARQYKLLLQNKKVEQQTRLFDSKSLVTKPMRSKEESHDYRYFPDPDLLPITISQEQIDEIKKTLEPLPDEIRNRLLNDHKISVNSCEIIISNPAYLEFYLQASELLIAKADRNILASWLTNELLGRINKENLSIEKSPVTPQSLTKIINLIASGKISGKMAKDVFDQTFSQRADPDQIVINSNLDLISDPKIIEKTITQIIQNNPENVKKYQAGKSNLFGWFVGQVMKELKGKANPKLTSQMLKKIIG